uniref:Periplasmic serine protease n=1 Tax=uncultured bacterium CSL11 TaxID=1091566 RepID=G4WVE8_9BACT|nr:periplasmic serine protease [uncultured bacterium CSL11]
MPAPGCSTALTLTRVTFLLASMLAIASARAGLADAIERVKPSVVAVGTFQKTRSPLFVFRGTGFAVGDGTLIATAAHAVPDTLQTEPPETMMVLVDDPGVREPQGREAKAIAVDRVHDVALLRIGGPPLPTVTLGDSTAVRDGLAIAFTGFPIGNALGFHPVTHRGIVSSRPPIALPSPTAKELDSRVIRGVKAGPFVLFQLDATAYPGHSGSPLYNAETGEVIGVVNMSVKATKDAAVGQATGISFAVPIEYLRDLVRGLR